MQDWPDYNLCIDHLDKLKKEERAKITSSFVKIILIELHRKKFSILDQININNDKWQQLQE